MPDSQKVIKSFWITIILVKKSYLKMKKWKKLYNLDHMIMQHLCDSVISWLSMLKNLPWDGHYACWWRHLDWAASCLEHMDSNGVMEHNWFKGSSWCPCTFPRIKPFTTCNNLNMKTKKISFSWYFFHSRFLILETLVSSFLTFSGNILRDTSQFIIFEAPSVYILIMINILWYTLKIYLCFGHVTLCNSSQYLSSQGLYTWIPWKRGQT